MLDLLIVVYLMATLGLMPIRAEATHYHPDLAGRVMRSGAVYDPSDSSIIAVAVKADGEPVIPLGTRLIVCSAVRCAVGVAQDTGRFPRWNLDMSPALFENLFGDLDIGRGKISYWRLEAY